MVVRRTGGRGVGDRWVNGGTYESDMPGGGQDRQGH